MSTMKFTSWQDLDGNEVANSAYPPGLVLVKSQTIGSSVTSVTVNDAFSSTFDNYVIGLSGFTASGNHMMQVRLGSSTTNYKWTLNYTNYATTHSSLAGNPTSEWQYAGVVLTGQNAFMIPIFGPNLAAPTTIGPVNYSDTGASGTMTGWHTESTSHTSFTLIPGGSYTISGGVIKVYGYTK